MRRKTVSGIMLSLLFIGMSSVLLVFNIQSVKSESVIEIGIGVYWDFNCSNPILSVDWGMLKPGENRNVTVYVRNEGNVNVTLLLGTANWLPSFVSNYVSLNWDYSGELLVPSQIENITLTLSVNVIIKEVDDFSFGIIIGAKTNGSLVLIGIHSIGSVLYFRLHIDPDTLNLKSKGKWITCYIELPEGYNVSDVDRATILLNGTIPVDPFWVDKPLESVIGDHDDDGIPDLMVKFSRAAVIEYLLGQNITYGKVTLTLIGELYDGTSFEGSDMIRVKMPSDVNSSCDECVDNYKLVVPEFPSFLILPLFIIATLLAVIIYRRKHSM